jgi:general secretion pathway protein K
LTAILLVALGTILATAMAYQNAMAARRAQATFALEQSLAIAEAGEALGAFALVQSRKGANQDYPGQFWSTPFGPQELVPGVMLQAGLEDMQGRFNLNNLVNQNGVIDQNSLTEFEQLLQILGLETKWAGLIADWIDADQVADGPDGAEDSTYLSQVPPYRTANRQITSASELLALPGFGRDRYLTLQPYVTALPTGTHLNLCTAPGPVLDAFVPNGERQYSLMTADALAKERTNGCFPSQTDYVKSFSGDKNAAFVSQRIGMLSDYFRLTSVVSVGTTQFRLYSLLHRESDHVHTIQRSFTAD